MNKKILIISVLAFLAGAFGVPYAISNQFHVAVPTLVLFSFLWILFVLLDTKWDRVFKGFVVIIYGIVWGILYQKYLVVLKLPLVQYNDYLLIFENLAIFSCSGAGGSLLANHADKSCNDIQDTPSQIVVFDKTTQIKLLSNKVDSLIKKINQMQWLLVVTLIICIVIIAI
ncbi:hypothetical protein MT391_01320 [Vibrio sp. 1-Bac 57]